MSDDKELQKLIKLAQTKNETADKLSDVTLSDVEKFIIALKLKEGRIGVSARAIYEAYLLWSSNPVKKIVFYQQWGLFFMAKVRSRTRRKYYELNYPAWEIIHNVKELKRYEEKK